jgi:predicted type IV restriction endonuclease
MNEAPIVEKKVPTIPKWEADAREKVKLAIKKFSKPLSDLVARDANEGDTRLLVTDFLCDGLGYDKYSEVTTEYRVKGEFADFGLRLDQQMVAFIEVKRVNTKLGDKQLRQVVNYALNEGCEWILLTNGHDWQIYRITAALPFEVDLVMEANILSDESPAQRVNKFFYLTREAMKRNRIDELWETRRATSPKALTEALCSDNVIDAIRKEIKKRTGQMVEVKNIKELLKETVIRHDCQSK